ncbi:MAG TPA: DsbA family protein [Candidatus Paceibacterota bacterium]|nr:DsbA family protein [Candidatus Paceibacterota bacterium]
MEDEQILTKKERRELRRMEKESERSRVVRGNKAKKYLVRGFILLALVAVVFGFWKLSQQTPVIDTEVLQINETDWIRGNENSAVTIIEYLDFQCPACGAYHPLVTQLVSEYGDRVRFVTRHFPITNIHPNAMPAARVAEAAGRQGKFWEMHDVLFENQQLWSNKPNPDETFLSYAESIGLNTEQFSSDYKDGSIDDKVDSDRNGASAASVTGTPTFFLNGKKMNNPRSYEEFKALVENGLREAETMNNEQ